MRKFVIASVVCAVAMGVIHVVHKTLSVDSSIQTAFPRQAIRGSDFSPRADRGIPLSNPVKIITPSKPKSVDDYWKQTDLDLHYVDELLKEKYCNESEKRFLACVSALIQMAKELRLQIQPNNQVVALTDQSYLDKSEKEILAAWKHFHKNQTSRIPGATVFSIQKAYLNLKKSIRKKDAPRITAIGLNAFISVDLDPHSYLMPSKYYKEIISKADPLSSNLGIVLREQNKTFVIRRVFDGSLAQINGLRRNDELIEVNGVSLRGLSKTSLQDLLRAEIGATTQIKVKREKETMAFTIQRKATTLKTVSHGIHPQNNKMGILTLNKFASGSCDLVERSLVSLKRSGATSVMLDLRDNSGGQIDEASCIIGLFTGPKKNIFQLKYFETAKGYDSYSTNRKRIFAGQVAVLINSNSASASEIVAGVLKEMNRALIVGDRSFGKGSFQEGEGWGHGSDVIFFKTQGLFYFPSGQSPQGIGVIPDIQVPQVASSPKESYREFDLYWSSIHNPEFKSIERYVKANTKTVVQPTNVTTWNQGTYSKCLNDKSNSKSKQQLMPYQVDFEIDLAQEVLGCLPPMKAKTVTGNVGARTGR
ncbi:MAG: S41 family peptidase [Pseudobdellovibrionaceae bacterium]